MENKFRKLRFSKSSSGHMVVSFGRKQKELVHRVIYETFVGKIPESLMVRHLNDDPADNRVANLAIGTQEQNMADALKNGHLGKKLNFAKAREIRQLKGMATRNQIATMYGVSEGTIKQIWANKIWRETA